LGENNSAGQDQAVRVSSFRVTPDGGSDGSVRDKDGQALGYF
jgi:hypothetical protein